MNTVSNAFMGETKLQTSLNTASHEYKVINDDPNDYDVTDYRVAVEQISMSKIIGLEKYTKDQNTINLKIMECLDKDHNLISNLQKAHYDFVKTAYIGFGAVAISLLVLFGYMMYIAKQ